MHCHRNFGITFDSNGGFGAYYGGGGGGGGVGAGCSGGGSGSVSNANYITDLAGPFASWSAGGGWGESATGDGFYGQDSQGRNIWGAGATIGAGLGATSFGGTTGTTIVKFW